MGPYGRVFFSFLSLFAISSNRFGAVKDVIVPCKAIASRRTSDVLEESGCSHAPRPPVSADCIGLLEFLLENQTGDAGQRSKQARDKRHSIQEEDEGVHSHPSAGGLKPPRMSTSTEDPFEGEATSSVAIPSLALSAGIVLVTPAPEQPANATGAAPCTTSAAADAADGGQTREDAEREARKKALNEARRARKEKQRAFEETELALALNVIDALEEL